MRRIPAQNLGIAQGDRVLFSDFEHDGQMWAGTGPRQVRAKITFDQPFAAPPVVQTGISMWDADHKTNIRADIQAEKITETGFDLVFRTWGDTRVARIRASWLALGAMTSDEDWQLY